MTNWVDKLATELNAGDTVMVQGSQFVVREVRFDPRGNTGAQPRYIVVTQEGWTFGKLPDMRWRVAA